MTNSVVLDASALLAFLNQEPGHKIVEDALPNAVMSAINVSEVISILISIGMPIEQAKNSVFNLLKKILPFDEEQVIMTAELRSLTKMLGLSLGDRACLALAKHHKWPVLTADKIWGKVKTGTTLQIKIIR